MEMIKGVLIDVVNDSAKAIEVEKDLETYYKILNCSCIDIVDRKIGKKEFNIICDDEGLFKKPQKISAINNLGEPQLVGNLFVVKFDGKEDVTSLDDSECKYVMQYIQKMCTKNYPEGYPILTQVEFI